MLKDLKSMWQEDPAALAQKAVNLTLGVGTAALLIATSVNIIFQVSGFAA